MVLLLVVKLLLWTLFLSSTISAPIKSLSKNCDGASCVRRPLFGGSLSSGSSNSRGPSSRLRGFVGLPNSASTASFISLIGGCPNSASTSWNTAGATGPNSGVAIRLPRRGRKNGGIIGGGGTGNGGGATGGAGGLGFTGRLGRRPSGTCPAKPL